MLTVKLIEDNGFEQMYEGTKVWANPAIEAGKHTVHLLTESVGDEDYAINFGTCGGTVYVMNSAGNTVARYFLGTAKNG